MSELSNAFGNFQSSFKGSVGSDDGSTQEHIASELANFAQGYSKNAILDKKQEDAERKAQLDAQKSKLSKEAIEEKANALRLFNAKGGSKLPEYDPNFSPAASSSENLEYANIGLRKEYNTLFSESKIKEENASIAASSSDLVEKWYQQFENLEPNDPLRNDLTGFLSHQAAEYNKQRFNDNLNSLPEIKDALARTDFDRSGFNKDIAETQQAHIDKLQGEFLNHYINTDYNGGEIGPPHSMGSTFGPPKTSEQLLKKIDTIRGRVDKGNGVESLYSRNKVHEEVIDNYTQRVLLAKNSSDPIFNSLLMFETSSGLALTDLQDGVGTKWSTYYKAAYDKKLDLTKKEAAAAELDLKRDKEAGEGVAFKNVNEISNLLAQAGSSPGSVTTEMIDAVRTTLHANQQAGYFDHPTLEDEYSQALENISLLEAALNSNSETYKPVPDDNTAKRDYEISLQNVSTLRGLGKELISVQQSTEDNPWLRKQKVTLIGERGVALEKYSTSTTLTEQDKKNSNNLLRRTMQPIQDASNNCIGGDIEACTNYVNLSTATFPVDLTNKDHTSLGEQIDVLNQEQWDKGKNLQARAVQSSVTEITTKLINNKITLPVAITSFNGLKNKTERQIAAWAVTRKQYKEQTDRSDQKIKESKSVDENIKLTPEIKVINTLEGLETKENEIKTNKTLLPKEKKASLKEVEDQRTAIKKVDGEKADELLSDRFNEEISGTTEGTRTKQDYMDLLEKVNSEKWFDKKNKGKVLARLNGLIDTKSTAQDKETNDKNWTAFDTKYKLAKSLLENQLTDIKTRVASSELTLKDAKVELGTIKSTFESTNEDLLKTTPSRYATDHLALITTAFDSAAQASVTNKKTVHREVRADTIRKEIKDTKQYKSEEKVLAVNAVFPALKMTTVAEIKAYKEEVMGDDGIIEDPDAKVLFSKEMNDIIQKILKGIPINKADQARLANINVAEYDKLIKNSSDISYLDNLYKTAKTDTSILGKEGSVMEAVTSRILVIKNENIKKSDLAITGSINDSLRSAEIWTPKVLTDAITLAKTITDTETQEAELIRLRGIQRRLEARNYSNEEDKKKLIKKQSLVDTSAQISLEILEILNPANKAEAEYTLATSDAIVKTSKTSLETLLKKYEQDAKFLTIVVGNDWKTPFINAQAELNVLQGSVSKQATAAEYVKYHNESVLNRELNRNIVNEALAELEASGAYTEDKATDVVKRINGFGADLFDKFTGEPKQELLFKSAVIARKLERVEIAKQKMNQAPKQTDQDVLEIFYREYVDKLTSDPSKPLERIEAGKKYINTQFLDAPPRISNSDFKYFNNKLNSFSPEKFKIQNPRMRARETIDSIFRTSSMFSSQIMIAASGGNWQEGRVLREALLNNFETAWKDKSEEFKGNNKEAFEWANEYAKQLINTEDKDNPLPSGIVDRLKIWTAGIIGSTGTGTPTGSGTISNSPGDPSVEDLANKIIRNP
jgi:hypothetical protein